MATESPRTQLIPAEIPAAVTEELGSFFDSMDPVVDSIDPAFSHVIGTLRNFVLNGGKRVRPAFAWQGWLGAGGAEGTYSPAENVDAVFRAVSALEFIQACALIHDDIIDSSDTRRGFPTVHKIYEAHHQNAGWHGHADHFGVSVAIIAGDVALSWADDMLHGAGLTADAISRVLEPWRKMRTEVLGGQLLDITAESSGDSRIETAQKVNAFKTASYTIERPLHLGAAIAGAPEELVSAYRSFGHDIGVAFQLRDDQLGVFGDSSVTGKPAGDDLREGKRTVLVGTALERLMSVDADSARFLQSELGRVTTDAEIAELRRLIEISGASEFIEDEISRLTNRAFTTIRETDMRDDIRENLIAMGIRATARAK